MSTLGRPAIAIMLAVLAVACAAGQQRTLRNFIQPPRQIGTEARAEFQAGRELFAKRWAEAEGLGPVFDAQSCLICHPRGGNGRPAEVGRTEAENASMILRFVAGGGPYGEQLQRRAHGGVRGKGTFAVTWEEAAFRFQDGEAASLRTPAYTLSNGAFGPFPARFSVTIAPKVAGTGALDAVPEAAIRALADPGDRDGDGISGQLALTADGRLGRFGWRGEAASIPHQLSRAFLLDMGLSEMEVGDRRFAQLVAFVRLIEPPPRAARTAEAARGEAVFSTIGCARCHRPSLATGDGREIFPFTDLLLHDLGEGLADGGGREWRTAPLWGLTLRRQVHGEEFYLHDGRARNVTEAIVWHGGEASVARSAFTALPREQRRALLAFLEAI